MNFLLTVCAGLLTYCHQVNQCNGFEPFDLDTFMKNFEKSQSDLEWIRDQSHEVEEKRNTLADRYSDNFDEDDENSVDHWYNKYRKSECSSKILNGYCGVNDDHVEDVSPTKPDEFDDLNPNYLNLLNQPPLDQLGNGKAEFSNSQWLESKNGLEGGSRPEQSFILENNLSTSKYDSFSLNSDSEDKINLEEYNDQMVPNPNTYKINNEVNVNSDQMLEDHDKFRSELGFAPFLTELPLKEVETYNQVYNDYGNGNEKSSNHPKKRYAQESYGNVYFKPRNNFNEILPNVLSDQTEQTKNDLSHEANYKLSKSEQESNNNKPNYFYGQKQNTNQIPNKFPKLANRMESMETSALKNQYPLNQNDELDRINNEIDLKISSRMMSKGLEPLLHGQSQDFSANLPQHRLNIGIENQEINHNNDVRHEHRNDLMDYVGPNRRLLQFDYEDTENDYHSDDYRLSEKRDIPHPSKTFKIGLIKTFSYGKADTDLTVQGDTNTPSESGEQIKLWKSKQENSEKIKKSNNETNDNQKGLQSKMQNVTDQSRLNNNTKSIVGQFNNSPVGRTSKVKIQFEFDEKNSTSMEENFKIKLGAKEVTVDRSKLVKRNADHKKQLGNKETKLQENLKNSSIVDLVSGKLPNQVIQAVFELVNENPRLNKIIGPKLDMKACKNLGENDINLFKSKQKTKKIIKNLLSSITGLIEDQMTHQTCILLPPDLQLFYDQILHIRTINSRANNAEKRNAREKTANSSKRTVRSPVPESDLHQRYKTVEQLLKQYGLLNLRDQMKIYDVKSFLQTHLELLDDLKSSNSKSTRQDRSVDAKDRINASKLNRERISREYANLLKTTRLIKTTSLADIDRIDVVGA